MRAEAVDQQHRGREHQLAAELRNLEGIEDRRDHCWIRARPGATTRLEILVATLSEPPAARRSSGLDDRAGPAGGLDPLARGGAERVGLDRRPLEISPFASTLTGIPRRVARPAARIVSGVTSRRRRSAAPDPRSSRPACGCGTARTASTLHVRSAQLSHPHVDRHLATLESDAFSRPSANRRPSCRGPMSCRCPNLRRDRRACAAAAAGSRRKVVQSDALLLLAHQVSSTSTRWRTACSMPRDCSQSLTERVWPIRRRPSERSVSC